MPPSVSVIIPTYNRARFISQTIDSVLAQTFTDYEIIVVDDGSTDETTQILAKYGDRLRILKQDNTGPSAARNLGLQMAQGEFIGFLDADDLWYPQMLATTVSFLRANPGIDIISGVWNTIDETGQIIRPLNNLSSFRPRLQVNFLRTIATGNLLLPLAILIRRRCLVCCGAFDTDLRVGEDWELWLRLAIHGHTIDVIDVPVAQYRYHRNSLTHDWQRMEQDSQRILTRLFTDERLTACLADLREHAYIAMWLIIAGYCQEVGMETERRKYVQMAEELYSQAPINEEVSISHLSKLFSLPETEHFKRMIMAANPGIIIRYYGRRGWQLFRQKNYSLMLERFTQNLYPFILGLKDVISKTIKRITGLTDKADEKTQRIT